MTTPALVDFLCAFRTDSSWTNLCAKCGCGDFTSDRSQQNHVCPPREQSRSSTRLTGSGICGPPPAVPPPLEQPLLRRTTASGTPYSLSIAQGGADKVSIHDVLFGEVWVCSGQVRACP